MYASIPVSTCMFSLSDLLLATGMVLEKSVHLEATVWLGAVEDGFLLMFSVGMTTPRYLFMVKNLICISVADLSFVHTSSLLFIFDSDKLIVQIC